VEPLRGPNRRRPRRTPGNRLHRPLRPSATSPELKARLATLTLDQLLYLGSNLIYAIHSLKEGQFIHIDWDTLTVHKEPQA